MGNTFRIECTQDPGMDAVFMIEINGTFIDYEFSFEDIKTLKKAIYETLSAPAPIKPRIVFHEPLRGDVLKPDLENVDKDSPFYGKKIVFTGELNKFTRTYAGAIVKAMGADIDTSITKRISYVIVGQDPGPKKMEKIAEFKKAGTGIEVLYEVDFENIITPYLKNIKL